MVFVMLKEAHAARNDQDTVHFDANRAHLGSANRTRYRSSYRAPGWLTCMRPGPEVIKLFSCSAQMRLLINVKMPTTVGILTFISRINYRLWCYKPSVTIYLGYFGSYEQYTCLAELSMIFFITSGPG